MTDLDLAPLAKAGNRAAANELLRRSRRELRGVVERVLRRQKASFELREDALAEGLIAVWLSLPAWDPARASLVTFAKKNVERAVWRLAALRAHAVAIPVAAPRKQEGAIRAREDAKGLARSMDRAQYGSTEEDTTPPLVETLASEVVDAPTRIDLARILRGLDDRDVEILTRAAFGEHRAEMAADFGVSRERANEWFHRAVARARQATVDPFRRAA